MPINQETGRWEPYPNAQLNWTKPSEGFDAEEPGSPQPAENVASSEEVEQEPDKTPFRLPKDGGKKWTKAESDAAEADSRGSDASGNTVYRDAADQIAGREDPIGEPAGSPIGAIPGKDAADVKNADAKGATVKGKAAPGTTTSEDVAPATTTTVKQAKVK